MQSFKLLKESRFKSGSNAIVCQQQRNLLFE